MATVTIEVPDELSELAAQSGNFQHLTGARRDLRLNLCRQVIKRDGDRPRVLPAPVRSRLTSRTRWMML